MLLGLLCGCGGQSAQAQPSPAAPEETVTATVATASETTVPEETVPEPPITSQEFLSKLNARLVELEIPLEILVYTGEDVDSPITSPTAFSAIPPPGRIMAGILVCSFLWS